MIKKFFKALWAWWTEHGYFYGTRYKQLCCMCRKEFLASEKKKTCLKLKCYIGYRIK